MGWRPMVMPLAVSSIARMRPAHTCTGGSRVGSCRNSYAFLRRQRRVGILHTWTTSTRHGRSPGPPAGMAWASEPSEESPPAAASSFSWLWTLLMIVPVPRSWTAAQGNDEEEEWDASRGIGDWRARLQRIYDAEAAAEAAGATDDDDGDDDDDDDDGRQGELELEPPAARSNGSSGLGTATGHH